MATPNTTNEASIMATLNTTMGASATTPMATPNTTLESSFYDKECIKLAKAMLGESFVITPNPRRP